MGTFEVIEKHGDHEQVVFCHNKAAGLKAIIAIHNTVLGPALGGTRMWNYMSEEDALVDVLRLSRGMTYKAAAAGLNLGGGKAVIIGDPKTEKNEALFRAFGQFVNSLNGRYITAEDVGTSVKDMEHVYTETPFVTGISHNLGGSGDPSPFTAQGTLIGIKTATRFQLKTDNLKGMRVAVQGLGHVGMHLVSLLKAEGAKVLVSDIDAEKLKFAQKEYGATVVSPEELMGEECEVLAPCALGAVINDQTLPRLKTKIVAGAANNQLAEPRHGNALRELGILYAPDFVINAGGLINVWVELEGYSRERSIEILEKINDNLTQIFTVSKDEDIPTYEAANRIAERRIVAMSKLRQSYQSRATRIFNSLKLDRR